MKYKITTRADSVYLIDTDAKTWERTKGAHAATIRSDKGTFLEADTFTVGEPVIMICPPINPTGSITDAMNPRAIISTRITKIEEIPDASPDDQADGFRILSEA